MDNRQSIRIKPTKRIIRECKTVRQIYEIILSMPKHNVSVVQNSHPLAKAYVYAFNIGGVCIYQFEGKPSKYDRLMLDNLAILQKHNYR